MAIPGAKYGLKTYAEKTKAILSIKSVLGGSTIQMPAFVTEFTQTFDSSWNQEEVYGRVDPIASFQGTKRTISVALGLPAGNIKDAKSNFDSCRQVLQTLYPGYIEVKSKILDKKATEKIKQKLKKEGTTFNPAKNNVMSEVTQGEVISRAPLVRVKYANLIRNSGTGDDHLLGYFTSVSWSPQIDMGYYTNGSELYPKVINLSFSFSVLHEHKLGYRGSNVAGNRFPF